MKWMNVYAVIYKNIIYIRRNMFRLFDITLWPLILFLSLTLFVHYIKEDPIILGVVILGVFGWRAVYHAQIELTQCYMDEYYSGLTGHFFCSPITLFEFMLANISVGILKFIFVAFGYVLLSHWLFDYVFTDWTLIIFGLLALFISGFIIGLFTLGICFIYHDSAFAVSFIMPDLIVLASGVYYPITVFPGVMQKIIPFFPTYYGFEILKASLGAGTINLPWLLGTSIAWLVIGLLFLESCRCWAMRRGLFAKLN